MPDEALSGRDDASGIGPDDAAVRILARGDDLQDVMGRNMFGQHHNGAPASMASIAASLAIVGGMKMTEMSNGVRLAASTAERKSERRCGYRRPASD